MNSTEQPSYREAAEEIDRILAEIEEQTEVDIDELARRVERAAELIRFCSARLKEEELRIRKVTEEIAKATAEPSAAAEETE